MKKKENRDMAATLIDEYRNAVRDEIPEEFILGQLFWYSFNEIKLPHHVMVEALVDAGITDGLPEAPQDVNVFKRVVTRVKSSYRREKIDRDKNLYEQVRVTDMADEYSLTKRVIVDIVNSAGKKIDSLEVADLVFDKSTATVSRAPTGTSDQHWKGDDFAAAALDEYDQWRGCFDTYNTREWVRKYIGRLAAIQVHPNGGNYFVPQDRQPKIEQLEQFVATVNEAGEYGSITLHPLPLIDSGRQREMVRAAYEAETIDALDELQNKMSAILADNSKKIGWEKFAEFQETWAELDARTKEYSDLLDHTLDTTQSRLQIATMSILQLKKHLTTGDDDGA